MNAIINLTQHPPTPEQSGFGVFNQNHEEVQRLLTFEAIPTPEALRARAHALAVIAKKSGAEAAMIGGAPFFMAVLEGSLRAMGVVPLYAFSRREVIETVQDNGTIKKTAIFRHIGFVQPDQSLPCNICGETGRTNPVIWRVGDDYSATWLCPTCDQDEIDAIEGSDE